MATACNFLDGQRRREVLEWYGRSSAQTYHEILGLPPNSDPRQLQEAFMRLARRFHPDAVASCDEDVRARAQVVFMRINEAYQILRQRKPTTRPLTPAMAVTPDRHRGPSDPPNLRPPTPPRTPERPVSPPNPPAGPIRVTHADTTSTNRAPQTRDQRVEEAIVAAQRLIGQGAIEDAVTTLHEVLGMASTEERRRIRLLLARGYVSDKRWLRYGLALLHETLREHPDDAEALTILGAAYFHQGLLARAEAVLARAVAADPSHLAAKALLRAVRAALVDRRTPASDPSGRSGLIGRLIGRTA